MPKRAKKERARAVVRKKPARRRPLSALTAEQAIEITKIVIRETIGRVPDTDVVEYLEGVSTVAYHLGVEFSGMDPEVVEASMGTTNAVKRLLDEVMRQAQDTGQDPDVIVIGLLAKMAPHGIPSDRWN